MEVRYNARARKSGVSHGAVIVAAFSPFSRALAGEGENGGEKVEVGRGLVGAGDSARAARFHAVLDWSARYRPCGC